MKSDGMSMVFDALLLLRDGVDELGNWIYAERSGNGFYLDKTVN